MAQHTAAQPLPACGESIGGLRPPFLVLKNADAKHRLWRSRAAGEGGLLTCEVTRNAPHPTPLPASGEREHTDFAARTDAIPPRPALDCRLMLPPDLILHSGKIITLDRASRVAEAIAVRSGHVAAVGDDAALCKEA